MTRGAELEMRLSAALALLAALAACGGQGGVRLQDSWPEKPGSFERVTRDWTRGGKLIADYDLVLQVQATFKSPEWRAAYVEHVSRVQSLPAEEHAALLAQQKKLAEEHHELELLVTTYETRENDFQKGKRSMWRLALADDQGNEVTPVAVKIDRRSRKFIRTLFPNVPDFSKAYIVQFPRTVAVLRPDAAELSLKISSVRGRVELVWRAK